MRNILFLIVVAAIACTEASGPQASFPQGLVRVSDAELSGAPGLLLADPVRVRVVDGQNRGVAGEQVTFAVTAGAGTISPTEAMTDSGGMASAQWTLGPAAGSNELRVSYGSRTVTFKAMSADSPGGAIVKISGGSPDLRPAGCTLGDPLTVRVNDASGHPVSNASVEFSVMSGGGSVTPAVAKTGSDGLARGTWTLGFDGGANVVHAILGSQARPSVEFTATTTAAGPNGYSVIGNKIYDPATCAPIVFHGVTRPSLQWQSGGDDEIANLSADVAIMKTWGANIMRLPITQTFWMPGDKQYDPGYKSRVIDAVAKVRAKGLAVIVDLHASDRGNTQYDGTPDAQKMPDRNISLPFWRDVANTFKNDGGVIFELYNEPHEITWDMWLNGGDIPTGEDYPGGPVREAYRAVGMQELYDAVRATGAKNLTLIGGMHWGYFLDSVPQHRVKGYNIVYSSHPYDWPDKQPDVWESGFGSLAATDPVIIGEFGAYDCSRLFYYTAVMDYADKKGMGWIAWAWWSPPPVSPSYSAAARQTDICHFPTLITDWSGTPSPSGLLIKARLATYKQ